MRQGSRAGQRSLATENLNSGHMDTTHVDADPHTTTSKLQPVCAQESSAVGRTGSQPWLLGDAIRTSAAETQASEFSNTPQGDSSQVWETIVQ